MLNVKVREEQGVSVATLSGRITMGSGDKVLHDLIDELLVNGDRRILLNAAGVQFIDSTGLGELVASLRTVEGMGGALGLVCPEGALYNALSMAKLVPVFQVFSHEEEAIQEFARAASAPGDQGEVMYDKEGAVAIITLNRPQRFNALTRRLLEELRNAVALAGHDPTVRAIVVTGAGRAFCFGADADELKAGDSLLETLDLFQEVVRAIGSIGKPILAAVNAFATGAGLDLALSCDIRVMSDKAKLASAFVNFGLVPDGGSTRTLQRLIGRGRAYELMATGRALSADEALAWGVVNRVVPHGEVLEATTQWAVELAAGPRRALGRMKQLLAENSLASVTEGLERERESQIASFNDAEFREGLDAHFLKRDPDFTDL